MGSAIIFTVSPCNQRLNASVSVVLPIFIELKIDWQWQVLPQHTTFRMQPCRHGVVDGRLDQVNALAERHAYAQLSMKQP